MAAGDITYSNVGGEARVKSFASGIVSADADTAINVIVGFVPSRIVLHYKDTGAVTNDVKIEWFKGITAGEYIKSIGIQNIEGQPRNMQAHPGGDILVEREIIHYRDQDRPQDCIIQVFSCRCEWRWEG